MSTDKPINWRPVNMQPPGFIFQNGVYICVTCGSLCPDSWAILQAHMDYHNRIEHLFLELIALLERALSKGRMAP